MRKRGKAESLGHCRWRERIFITPGQGRGSEINPIMNINAVSIVWRGSRTWPHLFMEKEMKSIDVRLRAKI